MVSNARMSEATMVHYIDHATTLVQTGKKGGTQKVSRHDHESRICLTLVLVDQGFERREVI